MVATIDGYDVVYTHRGSWRAFRRYRGRTIDEVPVAWDQDYSTGKPPQLIVWFKAGGEANERLRSASNFIVAMAKKKPGGASSSDIMRLFEVTPVEEVAPDPGTRSGLRCAIVGKCPPPDS